jgi:hypothetical protein
LFEIIIQFVVGGMGCTYFIPPKIPLDGMAYRKGKYGQNQLDQSFSHAWSVESLEEYDKKNIQKGD